ncbi:NUDIX hydrolase [Kribbia dieselivorans]|uniref:NUDIX hydrolase n=1 Tax=Kribbia dieselivorans TaxID=331526 RepID=UPI000838ED43|nr:NUDIX domain-containing protein [Kribbia dieselivorans]
MSRIEIVAQTGAQVHVTFDLPHGGDPGWELAARGWSVSHPIDARRLPDETVQIAFEVTPRDVTAPPAAEPVPTDHDLVVEPGEVALPVQRVAAYALVRTERGVLLTELAEHVRAVAGQWTLPGGGVDPGEQPADAVIREVWEESGQHGENPELVDVVTAHWVGRSPAGRLEDFHAIRLVHRLACPSPTDPVVHDVGGSTSRAAWFTPDEVRELPLVTMIREFGAEWIRLV